MIYNRDFYGPNLESSIELNLETHLIYKDKFYVVIKKWERLVKWYSNFTTLYKKLKKTKINDKDNEISSLREKLEGSQNIELRYKERKLDELVRSSGIN